MHLLGGRPVATHDWCFKVSLTQFRCVIVLGLIVFYFLVGLRCSVDKFGQSK